MNGNPERSAQAETHELRLRQLGIDTYQEPVIYMRSDCHVCRSEGFQAQARVRVSTRTTSIIATLNVVTGGLLAADEAGLSDAAWRMLGASPGERALITHPPPLDSLGHIRAKVFGRRIGAPEMQSIVRDVAAGYYSDVHLASFITACATAPLDLGEIVALTRAMIDVGERLDWGRAPIADKHCVGGLPGNRTTLLVVPILAAVGMTIPKTSSRSITSPAGTADTMETLAPVDLDHATMRRVVEREGGCIVWGGALHLSPADDVFIRVERPLDLDGEGQLIASVLSKKVAAGSTHVLIDAPVGPTAKIRSAEAGLALTKSLIEVGRAVGLQVDVMLTDGLEPVGRGIGPSLEARDVLSVLQANATAPADLRHRALQLAGRLLEFSGHVPGGEGLARAERALADGSAWRKFQAIADAQGGLREPPQAAHTQPILASRPGRIATIDNRRLARVAKLAGAPTDAAAGVESCVRRGSEVDAGQPLFVVHAQSRGELNYALDYVRAQSDIYELDALS
jgi:thymidine phosphorylase